ncbi:hypothetical protein ACFQLX_22770 [Streptomyces polyrhachis]|uniref:Uncharacterized protein n=1 Tax=Streptomyces polyrhachis TaxID=1282885 RepID=A0ABW2GK19_9ACTN
MSHRSKKSARARVAAVIAAPVLCLGFMAPQAAAAAAAPAQVPSPTSLCGPHPTYGGFFCDLNDIAGLVSGVLTTALKLTCLNEQTNFIICRVNTDNTPFSG